MHEIIYPGASANAPVELRQTYLDSVDRQLDHPAKDVVFPIARCVLAGETVRVEDAVAAMERLDAVCTVWSALRVVHFSCDDVAGVAESVYERVGARWREAG